MGLCDSTQAEALALVMGLHESKAMGVLGCLVEGDTNVVVNWGSGKSLKSWVPVHLIHEIRDLVKSCILSYLCAAD